MKRPGISGPAVMVAGYLMFGFAPVLVKMARNYEWWVGHTLLARFGFACLATAAIFGWARLRGLPWQLKPVNGRMLLWRGIFGGSAVLCYFAAIHHLGAGRGTLLNYSHSIFANLFGYLFFKHRPPGWFWAALAVAALGLWLVCDPAQGGWGYPEALGLLSGLLGGAAILTVKEARQTDTTLTVFAYFSFFGLIFTIPALGWGQMDSFWHLSQLRMQTEGWMILAGMALTMFGQLLFTQGYKMTTISYGTVLSLIVPLVAMISGWVFLNEKLNFYQFIGAILILLSIFITGSIEEKYRYILKK